MVNYVLNKYNPRYVINCAGIVGIKKCEDNPIDSYKANVAGVLNLIQFCNSNGSKLIHISTIYSEYNNSIYSRTKRISELSVSDLANEYLILRIPWLFGREVSNYILNGIKGDDIYIFSGENGYLLYDDDAVEFILMNLSSSGNISVANSEVVNRESIVSFIGAKYEVISREMLKKVGFEIDVHLRPWQEAMTEMIDVVRSMQPAS